MALKDIVSKNKTPKVDKPIKVYIEGAELATIKGIKGDQGDKPIKGEDYFTKDEVKQFKKEITPEKGRDYFTNKEIKQFKKALFNRFD